MRGASTKRESTTRGETPSPRPSPPKGGEGEERVRRRASPRRPVPVPKRHSDPTQLVASSRSAAHVRLQSVPDTRTHVRGSAPGAFDPTRTFGKRRAGERAPAILTSVFRRSQPLG